MFFILMLLFSALAVSAVAGYFSIVGLMAIFPAAAYPILAMGVVLEIAKLVTASWLYRYWDRAKTLLKTYFFLAVIVLSVITSMGIFGFLSKAHLEHSVLSGDNTLQIERLDRRIASEQRRISDSQTVLDQLDETVQTLIEYDRIRGDDGSIATRDRQTAERQALNDSIDLAQTEIDTINDQKLLLNQEQLAIEVEVGPILYVAEMIYGDTDKETIDKAVRLVILLLILVFDPLAILLVIATNMSLREHRGEQIAFVDDDVVRKSVDFDIREQTTPFNPEPEPPLPDDGTHPELPPDLVQETESYINNEHEEEMDSEPLTEREKEILTGSLNKRMKKKLNWLIDDRKKDDG